MDVTQYLNVFMEECREHIQTLNQSLLDLEKNPEDHAILDKIFRSAHTLKGASATMGYTKMSSLTHAIEDILSKMRSGEMQPSSEIMSTLFSTVDLLEGLASKISDSGKEDDIDVDAVLETLREFMLEKPSGNAAERHQRNIKIRYVDTERTLILEKLKSGLHFYHFEVELVENCVLKGARVFMAFREFEKLGTIFKSVPTAKDLEDENFDEKFSVALFTNSSASDVEKIIASISDIKGIVCEEITAENMPMEKRITATASHVKGIGPTVRVDIRKMDELMNLVAELVISRSRLENISSGLESKELDEVLEQVGRLTVDLRDNVLKARMIPVETILSRFPRLVRDLSKNLNKDIQFDIVGGETELDRTVIDEIGDPLLHIIRNSVDHGIEATEERRRLGKPDQGTIVVASRQEGNSVIIEVSDDGRGFEIDKVKSKALSLGLVTKELIEGMTEEEILDLTFLPGFSTSEKVTDISGRGVGMDVVKTQVTNLGGLIRIYSEQGVGSTIEIRLPLTLAIIQTFMISVGREIYAIPAEYIEQVVNIHASDIRQVRKQQVYMLRDELIPVVKLQEVLDIKNTAKNDEMDMIILKMGDRRIGCIVDNMLRQQDVVVKPLGGYLSAIKGFAGAAILGDGKIALIIDVRAVA